MELRHRKRLRTEELLQFLPRVSPHFEAPNHLLRFARVIERARYVASLGEKGAGQEVFALVSMPPQHGKTQLTTHGLIYAAQYAPMNFIYATYADQRARFVQNDARPVAAAAGLDFVGSSTMWHCANGSKIRWCGMGSGLGGYPLSGIAFIDDPYKEMAEAQSELQRESIEQWFRSVLIARRHPGASVIVLHTRWHPDDLIGTLKKTPATGDGRKWIVINFPAIDDDDNVLWPSKRPRSFYEDQRLNSTSFMWEALWQGRPRPRGMAVFQDVRTYDAVPAGARRVIGLDFAYTEKEYADYSVAVVMAEYQGKFYIENVIRDQVPAPVFAMKLKMLQAQYPGAQMHAFVGGTEKGVVDFLRTPEFGKLRIYYTQAKQDKLMRAQPVAAAWNAGKVFTPAQHKDAWKNPALGIKWLGPFIDELLGFTGVQDRHDDQVDALAGAYAVLSRGSRIVDLSK